MHTKTRLPLTRDCATSRCALLLPLTLLFAATQADAAGLVLSGNYCSVAPIANPSPGYDPQGVADEAASLNVGADEWFNDFTDSTVSAAYPATGTANGLTGNTLPGNGFNIGPNPFTNMFFSDGTAAPTGVTASWSAFTQDSFDDRSQVDTRREQLFGGFLQTNFGGVITSTITLTLAGLDLINNALPYDLYVYVDGEDSKQPGQTGTWDAAIAGTTYYGLDDSDFFSNAGNIGTGTYSQVTATSAAARQSGNYVKFSDLTGDGFTFSISSADNGVVLNAWEIVFGEADVPMPAPLALVTAGLVALGFTLRRARRSGA